MNNLSSYWGLVDAKIGASDKDLPVMVIIELSFLTILAKMMVLICLEPSLDRVL